jgi:hypothetical protein
VRFIVIHQIDELWFKLVLRELATARDLFARPHVPEDALAGAVYAVNAQTGAALLFFAAFNTSAPALSGPSPFVSGVAAGAGGSVVYVLVAGNSSGIGSALFAFAAPALAAGSGAVVASGLPTAVVASQYVGSGSLLGDGWRCPGRRCGFETGNLAWWPGADADTNRSRRVFGC